MSRRPFSKEKPLRTMDRFALIVGVLQKGYSSPPYLRFVKVSEEPRSKKTVMRYLTD